MKNLQDFVLDISFTYNGRWVISASKDREVRVWDAQTGDWQLCLSGHTNSIISVATSPTGDTIATASGDHTVRIWSFRELQ